jgi:predicted nucleic acid-binding protein
MKTVFDAGPFIHLHEIEILDFINSFEEVNSTEEIIEETRIKKEILKFKNIIVKNLDEKSKKFCEYIMRNYELHLGESTGIALCKQEKIRFFFTDDLDARNIAIVLGFKAHGTISIILRSYRKKIISKKECIKLINNLYSSSSLFLTKELIDEVIEKVENFKIR